MLRFKTISAAFAVSFILVLGGTFWSWFALKDISQPLILSYGLGIVNKAGGSMWNLVAFGITSAIALSFNFVLALLLEERDWFWGKFLAAASLFLSLLLFIGFAAIISVN